MQQKISLKLLPSEAADDAAIKRSIAGHAGKKIPAFPVITSSGNQLMQGQKPSG